MTETTPKPRILRIDASMRPDGASSSRGLADRLVETLQSNAPAMTIDRLDLAEDGPDFVSGTWIAANFTDAADLTDDMTAALAQSERLIERLEAAGILIIATPIYNFGPPAALKAWFDQVARARRTFRYTENGPVGLLEAKKAYVIVTSGGTEVGSEIDFATPWVKHMLGFLGIHDVEVIAAGRQMVDAGAVSAAEAAIDRLVAGAA